MKKNIEIKNIFFNRLYKKKKSKIINKNNSNNISLSSINNCFDNNKSVKINSNLYFKPRPIYIISDIHKRHNININTSKQKNDDNNKKIPPIIKTYKVNYNEGNFFLTNINTERYKCKYKDLNDSNKFGYNTLNDSIKSNSYKIKSINSISKINNIFFNYKYDNKDKSYYKNDKLNTYNYNSINNINNNDNKDFNKTFDSIYKTKNLKDNRKMNIRNLKNIIFNNNNNIYHNNKINEIKHKSSKNKDIVKLCKIIKSFENTTLINNEDYNEKILTLKKNLIEKEKLKNKYIFDFNKIILIQKWWKDMIYKKYIKKFIIIIQKSYRGYKFRKIFTNNSFIAKNSRNPNILNKIIYIQKFWKNYLMNIKLNSLNFSFTNNEDNNNINIINNNGVIYIGNSYGKKCHNFSIAYKNAINNSFITKKYYNNFNQQINNIIKIQNFFKKYLSNKGKINFNNNFFYKKNNNIKNYNNKSRNKKSNIKKFKRQIYNKDKNTSFVTSLKKEFNHFYNTPNKEKIKNKNILEQYFCSTMCYSFNYKKINAKYNNINEILYKQKNNVCFISKIRKNINLLNKISFLKNKIKQNILKNKFYFSRIKINICYINKKQNMINTKLKNKIILLQKNIKIYLKRKNNYNKVKNNEKTKILLSDIRYNLTSDISDEKKNYENSDLKVNNISQFEINDDDNNKYDIIIENNNNTYKNTFISDDVTTFSFDFKNQNNNIFRNDIENSNVNNNNNKENIEEDDISNNIDNISNIINFSSKNMLLSNEIEVSYKRLKYLFVAYITNKLSLFSILLLNRIHLFNFIKILSQRINKRINQFIFQIIFKNKKNSEINYNNNNEIIFYNILKRHIKFNLYKKEKNEIQRLLIENIPKCFKSYNNIQIDQNNYNNICNININIPYINKNQENNLLNTELFLNNDGNLIKYFTNFYINEKGCYNLRENILKHRLLNDKLKKRNLFTITKYMDNIYNDIFKNNIYLNKNVSFNGWINQKENINKKKNEKIESKKFLLTQINIKNNYKIDNKSIDVNNMKSSINNEFFKEIDENINDNEYFNHKNFIFEKENKNNNIIDLQSTNYNYNYTLNQNLYKFIDYINEKCKDKKVKTLPKNKKGNRNNNLI